MKLGDLTASADFSFNSDTISFIDAGGGTDSNWTYVGPEEAVEYAEFGITAGWYDNDYLNDEFGWSGPIDDKARGNDLPLPYGKAIIVQSGIDTATINCSGEVLPANKQLMIVAGGWNMLGNATPVDLKLGDIVAGGGFSFNSDTLSILDAGGGTASNWTYVGPEEAEEYAEFGITAGWYDNDYLNDEFGWAGPIDDKARGNNIPVPAGFGFVVQSGVDGAYIELPTPLAD